MGLLTTEKPWFKRLRWVMWCVWTLWVIAILYSCARDKQINYRPPAPSQDHPPPITPKF